MRQGRMQADEEGTSLLELMVAITILVVAILTAVYSQIVGMSEVRTSTETETAITEISLAMEEILTTPTAEVPVRYPPGTALTAFEGRRLQGQRVVPTYPGFVAGGPLPDPLAVVLTLTWNGRGGDERTIRLASARGR